MGGFSALASLGGAIASSVHAKNASDEIMKKLGLINDQEATEKAWFDKQYYTDITKRTDIQNMLRLLDEQQRKQSSINEAKAIVSGSTPEQKLAAQDSTNKATADATASIASESSALKDKYLKEWRNRQNEYYKDRLALQNELSNISGNISNQWAQAASNIMGTASSLLGQTDWSGLAGNRVGLYKAGANRKARMDWSDYTPSQTLTWTISGNDDII